MSQSYLTSLVYMMPVCDKLESSRTERKETREIVHELMNNLHDAIQDFFRIFNMQAFEEIVEDILKCQGIVFFTGVGKSGIVAEKIAATMSSSSTRSFYLSPQNALHGDLGMVHAGDTIFMLSKSGETSELIELCPALRNKGATLIAVVANEKSRLAKAVDKVFVLPFLKELCPFDLAPTTSTLSQLIFGDLLSMTLMRKKGITKDDFIMNHPGGRIGKRHLIRVRDLMLKGDSLPLCRPDSPLSEVLVELSNKKCGCICIVDNEGRLQGIFTDGDLRRTIERSKEKALSMAMHEIMTPHPRVTRPEALAYNAMLFMEEDQKKPITVLPVVGEDGKLVGMIRMHDILQTGL